MPLGDGKELGLTTTAHLGLQRCPHCNTANPTIARQHSLATTPSKTNYALALGSVMQWHVYVCLSCGGLVGAATVISQNLVLLPQPFPIQWLVPVVQQVSKDIPKAAAQYLEQARETLSSPAASVMTSASAVDAMLKAKGYKEGTLYSRIAAAETAGLLTKDMAEWAHDIRLVANDERHADEETLAKTPEDAKKSLDFADALAELLFVLPARVTRGRKPPTSP
jgi:hypothetical protein